MGTLSCDSPGRLSRSPEGAKKTCRMAALDASPGDDSPGPIYFLDPKVTRFGRSCTPAFSMQGRGKSRGLEVTPGPGTYSPEKVAPMRQRTPPAFSLGPRLCPPLPASPAPAPNAYTLPPLWGSQVFTKPCSPSFTVGGRSASSRPPQAPTDTPGPGQYECPDPNAYRPRPPAFSMQGRTRAPPSPGRTPGPAAPPGHPCAPSPERGAAPAPAGGGLRRRGQRTPFPG